MLDGSGLQVEVVCRSWEAILLDNEAQPGVIHSPSLGPLWEKYLKQLGLAGISREKNAQGRGVTVEKGMSCWEVLEGFCQDYLGVSPWVDGSGMLHCESLPESRVEAGPVLWAEFSLRPCKQLSTVWQQSYRGTYDTPFRGGRVSVGIQRQRYVSMEDGRDPRALICGGAAGEPSAHCGVPGAVLACPGERWPREGTAAGSICSRPVRSASYARNSRGERTRLVLEGGKAHVVDQTVEPFHWDQIAAGSGLRNGKPDANSGGKRVPVPGAAVSLRAFPAPRRREARP